MAGTVLSCSGLSKGLVLPPTLNQNVFCAMPIQSVQQVLCATDNRGMFEPTPAFVGVIAIKQDIFRSAENALKIRR